MEAVIRSLKNSGVGVLPTDTLYGLVGLALSKKAVRKIYRIRKRNPKKPMIILINSLANLKLFSVKISKQQEKLLKKIWPGPISVILPCKSAKFFYLHRGTKSLAFRLPKNKWLRAVLKKTGPLVAPSANFEGSSPAKTIPEAKKYFGDQADFYIDHGTLDSEPSTLISLEKVKIKMIRKGNGILTIKHCVIIN